MFGIVMRCLPFTGALMHFDWAEGTSVSGEDVYAIGTGQWRALPFGMNADPQPPALSAHLRFCRRAAVARWRPHLGIGHAAAGERRYWLGER